MKDLTQGSVTKHLLHMSAFLAASMLVQTLYLLADLYWVGHLGKEAIAAVGLAGNLTMIVLALTQMLGVGIPASSGDRQHFASPVQLANTAVFLRSAGFDHLTDARFSDLGSLGSVGWHRHSSDVRQSRAAPARAAETTSIRRTRRFHSRECDGNVALRK